ncbi:MAG: hypothetical protein ACXWBP_03270 [Limisphaerales bacterium]
MKQKTECSIGVIREREIFIAFQNAESIDTIDAEILDSDGIFW